MKDTPDGFLSYFLPFRKLKMIRLFDRLRKFSKLLKSFENVLIENERDPRWVPFELSFRQKADNFSLDNRKGAGIKIPASFMATQALCMSSTQLAAARD